MKICVALAFMLFLVGCVEKTSQIPSGIYTSSELGSEEKFEVNGSKIVCHIKRDGVLWNTRQYSYSISPDGSIRISISSNERFYYVVMFDTWTFDGKAIWIEEVKTKKKVSFVKN
jgi:hypothetical protein